MIDVNIYTRSGIKKGSVDDIHPKSKFAWVDCYKPTNEDFKIIAEKSKIPVPILKRSLDEDLRPRALDVGDYSEFIFRAYYSPKKGQHELKNFSIFTCADRNNLIILRNHKIKAIEKINTLTPEGKKTLTMKGIGYLLYRIIDEILFEYFEVLDDIEDEIEAIEEKIFNARDKKMLTKIFNMKKTLIYFYKGMSANREAISNIQKEFITGIEKKNTRIFRDLYSDCTQIMDIVSTYRELLTGAVEIHLSAASNNLNEIVKVLSSFAAIIMVPTLITGIYGMNFKFMPELAWKFGYPASILLMVVSGVVLFTIFRKKQWM
ncbi:MAG: magnesium/cobalt transporter CorA [Candidatus Woesearchaeota archaeon]